MYNQLIKQSNSIYVSIIFLILFGQNHLYVKDAILQGIPLVRRILEDSARKSENLWFPINRLDAHLSTVPSVRTTFHSVRTTFHFFQTTYVSVRTFTVLRSYCSSLHLSGCLSSPSGRLSVIDQLQILSKFN
jgi:hypothetical protein